MANEMNSNEANGDKNSDKNSEKKGWIHTLFAYAQDEKKKLGESVVLSVISIVAGLVPFNCM